MLAPFITQRFQVLPNAFGMAPQQEPAYCRFFYACTFHNLKVPGSPECIRDGSATKNRLIAGFFMPAPLITQRFQVLPNAFGMAPQQEPAYCRFFYACTFHNPKV